LESDASINEVLTLFREKIIFPKLILSFFLNSCVHRTFDRRQLKEFLTMEKFQVEKLKLRIGKRSMGLDV
jgi:hypothetical protein